MADQQPASTYTNQSVETLWVIRDQVRFLGVVPSPGFGLLEITVPPGSGTPPHRHESPEIFHIVGGEITFFLLDSSSPTSRTVLSGGTISVTPNQPHHYLNQSKKPATMLVVVNNQMIDFFRDVGQKAMPPSTPPSNQEIAQITDACRRHHIELLG